MDDLDILQSTDRIPRQELLRLILHVQQRATKFTTKVIRIYPHRFRKRYNKFWIERIPNIERSKRLFDPMTLLGKIKTDSPALKNTLYTAYFTRGEFLPRTPDDAMTIDQIKELNMTSIQKLKEQYPDFGEKIRKIERSVIRESTKFGSNLHQKLGDLDPKERSHLLAVALMNIQCIAGKPRL
jgi:hypothetical protein